MANLIAKSASDGLLPLTIGGLSLTDATPARITAIAPWPGKGKATGAALKKLGLDWPAANRAASSGKTLCVWSGRAQAFLINAAPDGLDRGAALTDISDGWVALALDGVAAGAALARLVPLDLGVSAFPQGASARTSLGHMQVLLHRSGADHFTLFVFRSMIKTAVHEIESAMKAVAARARV